MASSLSVSFLEFSASISVFNSEIWCNACCTTFFVSGVAFSLISASVFDRLTSTEAQFTCIIITSQLTIKCNHHDILFSLTPMNGPVAKVRLMTVLLPIIVQLPFPSQGDPDSRIEKYYASYSKYYSQVISPIALSADDLWEAPLWVAHLDAAIGKDETQFEDLSLARFDVSECVDRLATATGSGRALFLFSPLAQNLSLATEVSRALLRLGHSCLLGGNMTSLADPTAFSAIYHGLASRGFLEQVFPKNGAGQLGKQEANFGYRPNYRHLARFANRVTLARLNASHGCLYGCTFCGDAWSRQLHVVSRRDLISEFEQIGEFFPSVKTIYIGDKTFGQSPEAVRNILSARPPGRYKFVVQTHILTLSEELLELMEEIGVSLVELGFESADSRVLRTMKKSGGQSYEYWLGRIHSRGMAVALNLLGGLPEATVEGHMQTMKFIKSTADDVSLYNLYNFVPYPMAPIFAKVKDRIFDWDFSTWREDRPVVFHPYHQSVAEAWDQFIEMVTLCDELICQRLTLQKKTGVA
ncbi:radical SAM protein [Ensifer sp. MPMI2T]|nr:radical SAM protein [Ensifer sp. MPMI2T]